MVYWLKMKFHLRGSERHRNYGQDTLAHSRHCSLQSCRYVAREFILLTHTLPCRRASLCLMLVVRDLFHLNFGCQGPVPLR